MVERSNETPEQWTGSYNYYSYGSYALFLVNTFERMQLSTTYVIFSLIRTYKGTKIHSEHATIIDL